MIKIVKRSPNASRSPGCTSDCDISQSPNSSQGINPSNGSIRIIQKQALPKKSINFATIKNKSPTFNIVSAQQKNNDEPQKKTFKFLKTDASPEPQKQLHYIDKKTHQQNI